jgi:hypothetical protein
MNKKIILRITATARNGLTRSYCNNYIGNEATTQQKMKLKI